MQGESAARGGWQRRGGRGQGRARLSRPRRSAPRSHNFNRTWRAARGTLYKDVTQYTFRKAVATQIAEASDSKTAAKQLGHSREASPSDTTSRHPSRHRTHRRCSSRDSARQPADERCGAEFLVFSWKRSKPTDKLNQAPDQLYLVRGPICAPPSGLEPETCRLTVGCSAN